MDSVVPIKSGINPLVVRQTHVGLELLRHTFIIQCPYSFSRIGIRFFTQPLDGLVARLDVGFQLLFDILQRLDAFHQLDIALAFAFELCLHFVGHGRFGSRTVSLKLSQVFFERLDKFLAVLLLQLLFLHGQEDGLAVLVFRESRDTQKGEHYAHYFSKHSFIN